MRISRAKSTGFATLVVLCLAVAACRIDAAADLSQEIAVPAPITISATPTVAAVPTSTPAPTPLPTATPTPTPPPPTPTATPLPTPTPVPVIEAARRMDSLNVRLNFSIYHVRVDTESGHSRDLFRTHAWTTESEQLTDHGNVGSSIELSPNGRWLAYVVDNGFSRSLHVTDIDVGTSTDMGRITGHGFISWTPDSREVLVNHSPNEEPSGAIQAVSIDDGSRRTLIESETHTPSIAALLDDNDLVFWEIGTRSWRLVRQRLDTGERLAELETSYLGYRALDRQNQMLYLTQSSDDGPGSMLAIDLSQGGLDVERVPTPPNDQSHVAISPDGTRLAYGAGEAPHATELYFVDLTDPSAVLLLTDLLEGSGAVRGVEWAPASTAVVFGFGLSDREQLLVAAQDGTLWDIGVQGIPVAIIHDGT